MRSESTLVALQTIRDNVRLARAFVEGLTYEQFRESRLHFYAVTRALEIVSEASKRLPDDLRARHAHLPWRAIRDVGNLYRHEYDNDVWATVRDHLTPLLAAAETEIAALESGR